MQTVGARFVVMAVWLVGCMGPGVEEWGAAIRNGDDDTEHVSVGVVSNESGYCSGTLVGRRTILTAAHCVHGSRIEFLDGPLGPSTPRYRAGGRAIHPGFEVDGVPDLAVLRLASRVYDHVPSIVTRTAPQVGQPLVIVGYGSNNRTTGMGFRTRHRADVVIASLLPPTGGTDFEFVQNTSFDPAVCPGDSGGPSFTVTTPEEVIGVHSRGNCYDDRLNRSIDARTDLFYDWLLEASQNDLYAGGPIDVKRPSLQFVSPAAGNVETALVVELEASDENGVVSVELRVDGNTVGVATTPPYRFDLTLTSGPHLLRALALDPEGNEAVIDQNVVANPPTCTNCGCSYTPNRASAARAFFLTVLLCFGMGQRRLRRHPRA
jgi:hypothetical protein